MSSILKEEAKKLIDAIPDNATWDDIMYEIYVRQKIEEGLEAADAGRIVSQEDIEKRFCHE